MKIVFINTTDNKGGAAGLTLELKKGLDEFGYKTSLFVKEKHSNNDTIFLIKKKNKFLKKLSQLTGKDFNSYLHNKIHRYLSNDIEFFNNNNLLKSKEFRDADIIHCHNLHNNFFNLKLLSKISKLKPVVWSLHDMWAVTPHEAWIIKDEKGKVRFSMEVKPHLFYNNRKYLLKTKKNIYDNSNLHIVSTSLWFQKEVDKSILKNQKQYLIYNGIDESIFIFQDKLRARDKLKLPKDKKIITFMAAGGKHNPQKGWKYAKEVIKHYASDKNILFLCVGGNSKDPSLNDVNIKYVEYIKNQSDFALYYSASDIFFNPSSAEAFCLVLVQAMSCGVPVVTFATGIAGEAVKHKVNGYIAKYQNSQDLISGIDYILDLNEDEIKKMGIISRKIVLENFTRKIMIENYIKLYKDITK